MSHNSCHLHKLFQYRSNSICKIYFYSKIHYSCTWLKLRFYLIFHTFIRNPRCLIITARTAFCGKTTVGVWMFFCCNLTWLIWRGFAWNWVGWTWFFWWEITWGFSWCIYWLRAMIFFITIYLLKEKMLVIIDIIPVMITFDFFKIRSLVLQPLLYLFIQGVL